MDGAPALGVDCPNSGVAVLSGNPGVLLPNKLFEVEEIAELEFGICELTMFVAFPNNGGTVDETFELELVDKLLWPGEVTCVLGATWANGEDATVGATVGATVASGVVVD